ncbi:MAG: efflux RND transporter periplasmic adaptor subunit [Sphingomonas sp.]|nr:efflux RND transporter periplasmic adaptor subunit [Sphingomonas sp.]
MTLTLKRWASRPAKQWLMMGLVLALPLAACSKTDPAPVATKNTPGVISYAADAPELASLQLIKVAVEPLPISADLNARLAVDEDVTGRVGAPVSGRVTKVLVDLGEAVRVGQALAIVDAPDLAQARADLMKARSDADFKSRGAVRARQLFEGEAIARRDVEAANADAGAAAAELERARLRLANLGGGRGDALGLTSPVAGYVLDRQVEPGQQLTAGQGPLFTVTNPKRLWLLIDVPETAIARASMGQKVDFTVPAYPDRRFTATIEKIGLGVDPTTRRIQVRAQVTNDDLALKPEMFARTRLVTDDGRTAIKVPNAAVFEQGLQSYVFRVEGAGKFRRIPVDVASRGDSFSYVTAGIKPGERIVGEGALLLNAQLAGS